ncbi:hypothetical protein MBEBAB_1370 [Brevundimonas abyssalis TAR-001]|uniref:Uncharacterized protein n=1 Tax=Brevundimonas abyssalis TAR-001 TaxID=1391729 RepID=A0A8E0KKT3_9CAUL|nr:hypothetical protein MBEBAB_1370 [Brevundimonas abyssalis TAR-001]
MIDVGCRQMHMGDEFDQATSHLERYRCSAKQPWHRAIMDILE